MLIDLLETSRMKAAALSKTDTDRRSSRRRKALLSGKIIDRNGSSLVDCTIRDISDGGAGIEFAAGQIVPNQVFLMDIRSGVAYEAEVRWRQPRRAGLCFVRSFSLSGVVPEKIRHLKQLWEAETAAPQSAAIQVTPAMASAGLAAFAAWKPFDFRERDLVRAVFMAMYGAMPK
jgi:hypothetical protein